MQFSSQKLAEAVAAFNTLPGIGRKSALRLALHLLQQPPEATEQFVQAVQRMRQEVHPCQRCHNLSDSALCGICMDPHRQKNVVCVVESIRDVMAIEETGQFRGLYHVLGGIISPLEGVGPEQLNISSLVGRVASEGIEEIIMAISPTIEGETTMYYIGKQLAGLPVRTSAIARGVSFGGELEYADGLTLGRSIAARTPYSAD